MARKLDYNVKIRRNRKKIPYLLRRMHFNQYRKNCKFCQLLQKNISNGENSSWRKMYGKPRNTPNNCAEKSQNSLNDHGRYDSSWIRHEIMIFIKCSWGKCSYVYKNASESKSWNFSHDFRKKYSPNKSNILGIKIIKFVKWPRKTSQFN